MIITTARLRIMPLDESDDALSRRRRPEGTLGEADWFTGEWTTLERFAQLRR